MLNIRAKIVFISSCLMVFSFVLRPFAYCADADISASVDMNEMTIGDTINYRVFINLPVDARLKEPFAAEGSLGEFVIRHFQWREEKDNQQKFFLEYVLSIFKTGKHEIPEYNIEYRGASKDQWQALNAKAIEITVQSVLGDAKEPALKPLKPKIIIWRDLLPWLGGLLLIAGALWAGFKFWQSKHKALHEEVIVEAAHIIAYRELNALENENLITRGMIEQYYEKLSGCLRHYLENRFFLRAPWMSTEEFLQEVKSSPVLNSAQRASLKDFLLLSDLVKFARYGSSGKEASEAFIGAKNFIDQTKQADTVEEKIKP